jgi:SAM-dependent methyltransferase
MIQSKEWPWENVTGPFWQEPAEQVYYLASRWRRGGRKTFLDLGCGIGRHALFFAERGFSVDAFDLSEHGIAVLQKKATERQLSISTQVGDMLQLPYDSRFFDCVLAFNAIYHTDRKGLKQVISEIHRVLVEGGEAYLTFKSKHDLASLDSTTYRRVDENTVVPSEGQEAGIPHCLVDEQEIRRLLDGFKLIKFSHVQDIWEGWRSWHYFVLARRPR